MRDGGVDERQQLVLLPAFVIEDTVSDIRDSKDVADLALPLDPLVLDSDIDEFTWIWLFSEGLENECFLVDMALIRHNIADADIKITTLIFFRVLCKLLQILEALQVHQFKLGKGLRIRFLLAWVKVSTWPKFLFQKS